MAKEERRTIEAEELTWQLKRQAEELGFVMVGVTTATSPVRLHHLWRWLDQGFAGQMSYLERRREAYSHPSSILEGCDKILMLGLPYLATEHQRPADVCTDGFGKVARYAQCGQDYHDVIRAKLKQLKGWFRDQVPSARIRGVVDTAPLLEREFAEAAGLGWVGKNTLLLNKRWGSYFFLAALLTDFPLVPDRAHETSHCGTCTACLDNCPTQAFPEPFVLNATRCISYLTIEHSGCIEPTLADKIQGWAFGCDICQEVCPWNRRSLTTEDSQWLPQVSLQPLDIPRVLRMTEQDFKQEYRRTPLWRSGRVGMIRNAILVAGWQRLDQALPLLIELLQCDNQVLRATSAWAIGKIGGQTSLKALQSSMVLEADVEVRQTISASIVELQGQGPESVSE